MAVAASGMLSVHESCPVCTPVPDVVLVHTPKPDALKNGMHFNSTDFESAKKIRTEKYPDSIIEISAQSKECNNVNRVHNTNKPY